VLAPIVGTDAPTLVRVLVADDHPVFRGVVALTCTASDVLELVGEASSADEVIGMVAEHRPDVVVLDVDLPGGGIETIAALRAGGFEGKILVLTGQVAGVSVLGSLRAGADGYVERSRGLRSIGSSILRVSLGEWLLDQDLERAAASELGQVARIAREGSAAAQVVTERELEILRLVSEGLTMGSIGRRLGISPRTVESHLSKLYRKLGVRTRVQAVSKAAWLGLIDVG
jgi:two-component system, NarL family, nitrate/nitrite response regulator NarL